MNCERFKIGRFQTRSEYDNSISIINRNDSLQIETNLTTGNITKAHIKWISNCQYDLIYISSSDSFNSYVKSHILKTVIIQSKKDYYIAKSSMEGIDLTLVDTIRILK